MILDAGEPCRLQVDNLGGVLSVADRTSAAARSVNPYGVNGSRAIASASPIATTRRPPGRSTLRSSANTTSTSWTK
ncbi:MAG TPA: hypothetical protein VII33_00200 [Nakamurella sp.]